MEKNNEYYYSELEDKIIVDSINADFKNRQELRKPFELGWELNMNFYLGNQYTYISNSAELLDIEKNFFWENREVYNHIAPIIESRLAKLGKFKPEFEINTQIQSEESLTSSKITQLILNNCLKKNNIKKIIDTATHWSEITGTSFYKITWDSDSGSQIGLIDDKVINSGDVKISACSPFEIYPDSNDVNDLEDCMSIIYAKAEPIKLINEIYHTEIDGDEIDAFELENQSYTSHISGRSSTTKIIHTKKSNYAYLIERYEKPSSKHPTGKLTIICKDKLLFDGDLPYKTGENLSPNYPFVKQVSINKLSCFWGSSIIDRCIPIQRAYNALKNKKHEYISRLASGILTVEDGSVDIDNLEDEGLAPGKILVYRNGSTPPKFMSPGTIPAELEKEEESLLDELNNLSGISDITKNSTIPANITSGSAISLLISQDDTRLSLTTSHIKNAITQLANFVLKLFKQYATTPRVTQVLDSQGITETLYWSNSHINANSITLKDDNDETNSSRQNIILSLYTSGLFNDKNGEVSTETKKQIAEAFDIKNFVFEESLTDIQKQKAKIENNQIDTLDAPCEIDDHTIHIEEHSKFLLTHDLNEKSKTKLLEHINQHKKLIL